MSSLQKIATEIIGGFNLNSIELNINEFASTEDTHIFNSRIILINTVHILYLKYYLRIIFNIISTDLIKHAEGMLSHQTY